VLNLASVFFSSKAELCILCAITIFIKNYEGAKEMKAFVTVLGEDKVGIIYGITSVFKETNVNVLDVNQTLLGGFFTMIMLVDLEKMNTDFGELKHKLEVAGEQLDLSILIQREDIFNSMHKI